VNPTIFLVRISQEGEAEQIVNVLHGKLGLKKRSASSAITTPLASADSKSNTDPELGKDFKGRSSCTRKTEKSLLTNKRRTDVSVRRACRKVRNFYEGFTCAASGSLPESVRKLR
jgi:hypothetical protein